MGWSWSDSVWGGFEPKSGVHGPKGATSGPGKKRTSNTILRGSTG